MVKCPRCGFERTRVIGGEQKPTGYARKRQCPKCLKKFETLEQMTGIYKPKLKGAPITTTTRPVQTNTT